MSSNEAGCYNGGIFTIYNHKINNLAPYWVENTIIVLRGDQISLVAAYIGLVWTPIEELFSSLEALPYYYASPLVIGYDFNGRSD